MRVNNQRLIKLFHNREIGEQTIITKRNIYQVDAGKDKPTNELSVQRILASGDAPPKYSMLHSLLSTFFRARTIPGSFLTVENLRAT